MYIFSMKCHHQGINAFTNIASHQVTATRNLLPSSHRWQQIHARPAYTLYSNPNDNPSYASRQCQRHGVTCGIAAAATVTPTMSSLRAARPGQATTCAAVPCRTHLPHYPACLPAACRQPCRHQPPSQAVQFCASARLQVVARHQPLQPAVQALSHRQRRAAASCRLLPWSQRRHDCRCVADAAVAAAGGLARLVVAVEGDGPLGRGVRHHLQGGGQHAARQARTQSRQRTA